MKMEKFKNFVDSVIDKLDKTDIVCSECFAQYDEDGDDAFNVEELSQLMDGLLLSEISPVTEDISDRIFNLLDEDKNGKICQGDFRRCGYYWLKQTLKPVSALVIVDVQNDFIDGSLSLLNCPAQQNGAEVIPVINKLLDEVPFSLVVYTKDWHPENHISFIDNVKLRPITQNCKIKAEEAKVLDVIEFQGPPLTEQKMWPKHCVKGTHGSELHPDLKVVEGACFVNKGCHPEVDSYSAFWDNNKLSQTDLVRILAKHRITDVYCCGVAYDVCVGFTAFHSLEHGFRTIVIDDACRGVDDSGIEETKTKLVEEGGVVVHSSQVNKIVTGEDRPAVLGLQTAKNVALARELVNRGIVN